MVADRNRQVVDDIRLRQAQVAVGPAGTDPPYVADREVFDAYTHQEIWELVHQALSPEALGRTADGWHVAADQLEYLFDTFAVEVTREFAEWSGQAATVARQYTDALLAAGAQTHATCLAVHRLMDLNASAAQWVRDSVPPPPPPRIADPDPVAESVEGGRRRMQHDMAVAAVLADVQDAMSFVYNPTLPASGDSVPGFAGIAVPGRTSFDEHSRGDIAQ